jgi:hypothetical protein
MLQYLIKLPWLPQFVLAIWLTFVAWAVWQHAERSEQPPIYDALSYFHKAKAFWGNLKAEHPINPFDLEPTVRPPGTVLMSYPFGFSTDVRGFYFRSVVFPIFLLVAAVYLVGYVAPMNHAERWDLPLLAMYLSSLPMFYHFEVSPGSSSPLYWGLVDNFLATMAALAAAVILRSARDLSLPWLTAGAFLAALCFLIKPAGVFVVATLTAGWLVTVLLCMPWPPHRQPDERGILRFLLLGSASLVLILGPILITGFSSKYFSKDQVSLATQVLAVMEEEWWKITPAALHPMIHTSTGYPLLIGLAAMSWGSLIQWRRGHSLPTGWCKPMGAGLSTTALIACLIGIWFWIVKTGGSQVRYFYPFALIALICSVPFAQSHLARLSGPVKAALRATFVLHVAITGSLLGQTNPPIAWQNLVGINLSSGTSKQELEMGQTLVDEVMTADTDASLYSIGMSASATVVESVLALHSEFTPQSPRLVVKRPVDWVRPSTYRLAEIYEADYVLFEPLRNHDAKAAAPAGMSVQDFRQETELFNAWFTGALNHQGLAVVSQTPTLRLLRVTDTRKLEAALRDLQGRYTWRPAFVAANPRVWWNKRALAELKVDSVKGLDETRFGDHFELDAVGLHRRGSHVDVRLWWHRLGYTPDTDWYFFFHSIDSNGTITGNHNLRLTHRMPRRPEDNIRYDTMSFDIPPDDTTEAIAFGIYGLYGGSADPLPASKGLRDWNGHRVIIPLPKAQSIAVDTN